jgi:hypothetical protein
MYFFLIKFLKENYTEYFIEIHLIYHILNFST